MTFKDYLEKPDALSLTELSNKVGVSKSRLSQLRNSTNWPGLLALDIERATNGLIDAAKLSPVIKQAREGQFKSQSAQ
jgi:DNA-binding transcriptional regulator YdaS (Cro superfamily)